MAIYTTSFSGASEIDAAFAAKAGSYSPNYGIALSASSLDRVFHTSAISATQVGGHAELRFANGDSASLYGNQFVAYPIQVTHFVYRTNSGNSITMDGSINIDAYGMGSGVVTGYSISAGYYGTYTVTCRDDISTGTIESISKIAWSGSGVQFVIEGSMNASAWNNGAGGFTGSVFGTISTISLTYGSNTFQVSGISMDPYTLFSLSRGSDFIKQVLANSDTITGSAGANLITGYGGNDAIDGGNGVDTAIYVGASSNYTVTKTATGYQVTDKQFVDGTDTLRNIERLQFSDKTLALDISGDAGQVYRIYQAAFDRRPDNGGLKYWIGLMDGGMSLEQVAGCFLNSTEFKTLYGNQPSNSQFVTNLYQNVLHRVPDQGGYDYWVNLLDKGGITRTAELVNFSESAENQAAVIGVIQNGIELLP